MTDQTSAAGRLLPWVSPEGKPCYLFGDGTGYVSRHADDIEGLQLDMAGELLDHAADMDGDQGVTSVQLRYVVARLAESLRDLHRIARSRGARLDACGCGAAGGPGPSGV
ncbi:hypothetical protein [Streptomyces sp. NBC_00388]|uniref:hypothetical protein n=1 Tax=Streptomyces sp. NBC_00388 TaxID=2975735 RepID=UPI002E1B598F